MVLQHYKPTNLALQLAKELKEENIRFVHFKSNSHLNEGLAGLTDLDILIHKKDANDFQKIILKLGFRRLYSPVWSSYPSIEDWIGLDCDTERFLHLHVHYAILTGFWTVKHLHVPWEDMVFKHLFYDSSTQWPIPKAEVELAILLVRIWAKQPYLGRLWFYLTKNFIISKELFAELMMLLNKSDIKELLRLLREETNLNMDSSCEDLINKIKKESDMVSLATLSKMMNLQLKNHWRSSIAVVLITALSNRVTLMAFNICRRLGFPVHVKKTLQPSGLMVAFIGCDGAGKSTSCKDIVSWLNYKIDVHQFYFGSGVNIPRYLRFTIFLYQNIIDIISRITSFGNNSILLFYNKLALLPYLYLIWRKRNMIRKARSLCIEGSIIIADRFPQIQQLDINDGPKLQNGNSFDWAAKIEMDLFKQCIALGPDIVVRLNVSSDIAHKRKPEDSFSMIQEKTRLIGELTYCQAHTIEVDANRPYSEVLSEVKLNIWKNI